MDEAGTLQQFLGVRQELARPATAEGTRRFTPTQLHATICAPRDRWWQLRSASTMHHALLLQRSAEPRMPQ